MYPRRILKVCFFLIAVSFGGVDIVSAVESEQNETSATAQNQQSIPPQPGVQPRLSSSLQKTPAQVDTPSLLDVTFGLLIVLAVIAGAAWLVRRFGHFQVTAKGNIKIIGGLHMSARERVVLLQVGEQQILLGVAPGRIQTLHVLPTPIQVEQSLQNATNGFAEKLVAALKADK